MTPSIIIAVAPNGARKTKQDHLAIPLTAKELGETAKSCLEAGASMIHLHVRDKYQKHSISVDLYREAIEQIRFQTDNSIYIQVTSESVRRYSPNEQFEMIHSLKPPAVSIGLREIRRESEAKISQHFIMMRANKVYPQVILYNNYDISMYKDWLQRGVLPGSAYPVLLVIGKQQKEGAFEVEDLNQTLINDLPYKSWMTCGFGYQEFEVAQRTIQMNGNIRLGFENNDLLENKQVATDNADLIFQSNEYINNEGYSSASFLETLEKMKPDW